MSDLMKGAAIQAANPETIDRAIKTGSDIIQPAKAGGGGTFKVAVPGQVVALRRKLYRVQPDPVRIGNCITANDSARTLCIHFREGDLVSILSNSVAQSPFRRAVILRYQKIASGCRSDRMVGLFTIFLEDVLRHF